MALRNAFANVATEDTLEEIRVDQLTMQRELLEKILNQLQIMNLHLSMINDEEFTQSDLNQEADI